MANNEPDANDEICSPDFLTIKLFSESIQGCFKILQGKGFLSINEIDTPSSEALLR